jgi:hypothetical protein
VFDWFLLLLEGFVRRRIALAAVLAVGLALGSTGCTFLAPTATAIKYNPSDGVSLDVGALQVRNAFVISPQGTDANLIGVFLNSGKAPIDVELEYTAHVKGESEVLSTHFLVEPGRPISFGNPGVKQVVFRNANAKAGALLKVFIQYGTTTGKNLLLPVLDGSQAEYSKLTPSPLPKPTRTSTAPPTSTPTPSN